MPNVCSLVPERNPAGEPIVMWAVRLEKRDPSPAEWEKQSKSSARYAGDQKGRTGMRRRNA